MEINIKVANNDAIDYINRDIVNVKNELHVLNKLVRDGNGQPSLIQQMTSLNSKVTYLEEVLTSELCDIKEAVQRKHKASWQFRSAVAVAIITSLTSLIIGWQDRQYHSITDETAIKQLVQKVDALLEQKK